MMRREEIVEEYEKRLAKDADRERKRYDARPVSELLAEIRCGQFGKCYEIWSSIGERATLAEAGSLLADILESDASAAHHYPCAEALIKIGHVWIDGYRAEQLTYRGRRGRLKELRAKLRI